MGGSAGGLLMGAIANLSPEDYRGIVRPISACQRSRMSTASDRDHLITSEYLNHLASNGMRWHDR